MAQSATKTVAEYLKELPADRRDAIETVRAVILKNLPAGFVETMGFGMISYIIPLLRYPKTYNGQPLSVAALASQKTYLSLHLMSVYGHKPTLDWFLKEYEASGKQLDMGKACVHFRKSDDLALDVIGKVIARVSVEKFIEAYEKARAK